jgi:hypothetical protein
VRTPPHLLAGSSPYPYAIHEERERETERYPATPLPPDEHQRRAVRGSTARAFGVPPCPQHVDPALKHCSSVAATGQQQQQQQLGGMPLLLPCDYQPGDGDTTALQYPGCYGRRMCWALWQLGALAEQHPPSGAARAGPGALHGRSIDGTISHAAGMQSWIRDLIDLKTQISVLQNCVHAASQQPCTASQPLQGCRQCEPWTAAAAPIDPATAWPNGLLRQRAGYLRLLPHPVSRPGSSQIDRSSSRRKYTFMYIIVPESCL